MNPYKHIYQQGNPLNLYVLVNAFNGFSVHLHVQTLIKIKSRRRRCDLVQSGKFVLHITKTPTFVNKNNIT